MLSKYGILYSKYLEEYKPITYQELIMNGTINEVMKIYSQEIANQEEKIEEELKTKYPKPDTEEFIAIAQYQNMIQTLKIEIINNMIQEKVQSM